MFCASRFIPLECICMCVWRGGREGVSPSLSTTENYEPQEKLLMASLCCGGFVSLDERKRVRGEFSIAEGEGDNISNISRTYFHFLLWLVDGHHPHLRRVSQYNADMVKRFAGCRGQEADGQNISKNVFSNLSTI